MRSLVEDHPLINGNERLGWLSTAVFFGLNGIEATQAEIDDVYGWVMSVAAGQSSVEETTAGLRRTVG